jgi:hypothetical protein
VYENAEYDAVKTLVVDWGDQVRKKPSRPRRRPNRKRTRPNAAGPKERPAD